MDYKEACEKVQVLANGRHNSVRYERSFFSDRVTQECVVYINGPGQFTGKTWQEVLDMVVSGNRKQVIDDIPSIPELEGAE